jgi:multiple sugar transport system substrate-binding protein
VLFRRSQQKQAAWRLIEFLSRSEEQVEFYRTAGNLPAKIDAWQDPSLAQDERLAAFAEQLQRVVPTPMIPEWELITTRIQDRVESLVYEPARLDSVLLDLDRDVWRILEKRRWLLAQRRSSGASQSR